MLCPSVESAKQEMRGEAEEIAMVMASKLSSFVDLPDDLLVEILSCLSCNSSIRCKSISKRFLNLIAHRYFIERFIGRHRINNDDYRKDWSLIFLSRHKLLISFLPKLVFELSNPQFQLSLRFLGSQFDPEHEERTENTILTGHVIGCSNGLLLCKKSPYEKVYYVCNPITRDWVQLPPVTGINGLDIVFEGFICEPYYYEEAEGVTVRPCHRFRVVLIPYFPGEKSEFQVVVFSSETGRWSTNLVSCKMGFTQSFMVDSAVCHRGRLCFVGAKSVLVYDAFNNDRQCHILNYPRDSNPTEIIRFGHVGVSCGNIRICEISPRYISVWELKEDSAWHLLHRTCLPPLEWKNSVRPELGIANISHLRVRAFHPYDGVTVFFQYGHSILFGNLKTNKFETAGYGIQTLQVLPLEMPCWPTPVPK